MYEVTARHVQTEARLVDGADRTWAAVSFQTLTVTFNVRDEPRAHYQYGRSEGDQFMPFKLTAKYVWTPREGWKFSEATLRGWKIKSNGLPGRVERMNQSWSLRSIDDSPKEWPTGAVLMVRQHQPTDSRSLDIVAAEQVA